MSRLVFLGGGEEGLIQSSRRAFPPFAHGVNPSPPPSTTSQSNFTQSTVAGTLILLQISCSVVFEMTNVDVFFLFSVLAIELLAACQGIEFLRPLKTTEPLEAVHSLVRKVVK